MIRCSLLLAGEEETVEPSAFTLERVGQRDEGQSSLMIKFGYICECGAIPAA